MAGIKLTTHTLSLEDVSTGKKDISWHGTDNEGTDLGKAYEVKLQMLIDYFNPLGKIAMYAGNTAPLHWMKCEGQILQISENPPLFAILGSVYGGDGTTTFALPDLRGRSTVGTGTGAGLTTKVLGETGGLESVVLNTSEIPSHNHNIQLVAGGADTVIGQNNAFAVNSTGDTIYSSADVNEITQLKPTVLTETGGGQAHENRSPYLAVSKIIYVGK